MAGNALMPNYVEIYFGSTEDRERVAGRVGSALGIPFEPSDQPYADYLGRTEDVAIDLKVGHELEDDAGVLFEDMPYVLTVRDFRRGQLDEPAARKMFVELDRLGYRPIYLVRGLQEILASID
ncbi:hypothetical protein ACIA3K_10555 [Micromonospora sp. NPDC051543]|uniref:hypothetical protein n=1 Tax=Micromonospora sp. NPDC051543 TaxID=3364287 RepID=UPI0037AD67DC